ncbi:MAG: 23S rRNA (pseudouridine(1915)-N(3))-methyltransferase RlmH [Oscillospiraceae bacterium]|nr:23S rRNA (pseudouridine(1915)-N(3))-methyltransferase RlmH [Oscillospiraceae bacterium]
MVITMTFTIISVGRLKEAYFADAAAEYVKRIGGFSQCKKLTLIDVKESKNDGEITERIPPSSYVFALCIEGKQLTSRDFSAKLEQAFTSEKKGICFIIGGSEGLSEGVKSIADMRLSMSEMTFPHRLAKIMLLEQLYRALSIQNNRSYHK